MSEDEIRALKRELRGTLAKQDQKRQNEILAELELRGEKHSGGAGVEKRAPGRPKKSAE